MEVDDLEGLSPEAEGHGHDCEAPPRRHSLRTVYSSPEEGKQPEGSEDDEKLGEDLDEKKKLSLQWRGTLVRAASARQTQSQIRNMHKQKVGHYDMFYEHMSDDHDDQLR